MALIVSTCRGVANNGKSIKAESDTLIYLNEEEGRKFVQENKDLVLHVQKGRVVDEQRND